MTLTCSRSDARHVPCVIEPHVICRATLQGNAETLVDLAPTVTASAGMSGNNQPVAAIPYTLKIRGGREGGGKGILIQEDKSATLATGNDQILFAPHTLCIQGNLIGRSLTAGPNGGGVNENVSFTLNTVDIHAVTDLIPTEDGYVYLVRKLTPTECASLQGFSKSWCDGVPHRDAPEYKMWGNGMAFPCMLYIMESVSEVLKQRQLDRLINSGKVLNE